MVEKNTQKSLNSVPSINNNAQPYIIPLDIYKEGAWAYDISNYYKGRVNDNGTPFEVRWYEHGRLKNVQGMRPFMRGQVGTYTVEEDENGNERIVMANDATQIEVVGETTDCREGGIAIYRMVDQAFPQDGIFFGYIGLRGTENDGSVRETGIDVIFKVLGAHMNMLGARNYYVSELEQALIKFDVELDKHEKEFKQRADQTIQEINDKINQEIATTRSTLSNLQSQIDSNRAEQERLTEELKGTQRQISINNVVTVPEFNDLSSKLTQQVSEMRQNGFEFFDNYGALVAKYPNGANKLCVTLDDSHQWIYDNVSNSWKDTGAFNYGGLDPSIFSGMMQSTPDNLISNSDFNGLVNWTVTEKDGDAPDYEITKLGAEDSSNVLLLRNSLGSNSNSAIYAKTTFQ